MLNFYMCSPSPHPTILSFFLFLSISGSRKTLENMRWADPSLCSHKTLNGRVHCIPDGFDHKRMISQNGKHKSSFLIWLMKRTALSCCRVNISVARSRNYFLASTGKKFGQGGNSFKIFLWPLFCKIWPKFGHKFFQLTFFFSGFFLAFWLEFQPPGNTSCCPATHPPTSPPPLPPLLLTPPIPSGPPGSN